MLLKSRYTFIAVLSYDDDGISISFPDLPGCLPCAANEAVALKRAKEALGLHLWCMERDGEAIPKPTPLKDIRFQTNEAAVVVDVFMPSVRERVNCRFVKKTLSLPAWLAAVADENDVNCSKLFQNALMEHLNVRPPSGPRM